MQARLPARREVEGAEAGLRDAVALHEVAAHVTHPDRTAERLERALAAALVDLNCGPRASGARRAAHLHRSRAELAHEDRQAEVVVDVRLGCAVREPQAALPLAGRSG